MQQYRGQSDEIGLGGFGRKVSIEISDWIIYMVPEGMVLLFGSWWSAVRYASPRQYAGSKDRSEA